MAASDRPIRVAILGGGIAGATVFRALDKHSQLKVDIFESAPVFREQGAGMGINNNAQWALESLGIKECIQAAGGVEMNNMQCVMGQGPHAGEVSFEMRPRERPTVIIQRSPFLTELLKGIDPTQMHAGKKLERLEEGDEVKLFFEDGSTHVCDVVIGADGIRSTIRKYVLGQDDVAAVPVFAGWWNIWTLVPFEKAQQLLGEEFMNPDKPRQYCWCGDKAWVMHDQLSNNTLAQCVVAVRVPEDSVKDASEFMRPISRAELSELLDGWLPHLSKGMVELVTDAADPVPMFSMWHHKPMARRYVKDNIAIVGDAADATTPWKGSGGGMAMEDAFILSELFARVHDLRDAKAALKAYEQINKPRRQRLVEASYDTGLTFSGAIPGVGRDPKKMKERLEDSWDWIVKVDLAQNRDDAIKAMQQFAA